MLVCVVTFGTLLALIIFRGMQLPFKEVPQLIHAPSTTHGFLQEASERWADPLRRNNAGDLAMQWCWRGLIRSTLRMAFPLDVVGCEHLPAEPPFVMVANHSSHMDTAVLDHLLPMAWTGRVFPLAAADKLFDKPWRSAFVAKVVNGLAMPRGRCVAQRLKVLRKRLESQKCGFIIFPEGGRSRDGAMGSFKRGVGALVAQSSVPVIPVGLSGTSQAMPVGAGLPKPSPIRVRVGVPLTFEKITHDRTGWNHIADECEQAVRSLVSES